MKDLIMYSILTVLPPSTTMHMFAIKNRAISQFFSRRKPSKRTQIQKANTQKRTLIRRRRIMLYS